MNKSSTKKNEHHFFRLQIFKCRRKCRSFKRHSIYLGQHCIYLDSTGWNRLSNEFTYLAPSEPVLSIGYRSREDLVATLHRQSRMYFSSGVVTNGILDNVAFQTWIQKTPQSSKKLEFTEFFLKLTTHPSVFFSTLDGLPGSSGQGIFDHDGNLVGVARAIMKFDSNILEYYVPGTLQSITVASIIEHLNEINHPEINDIFECSQ